MTAAPGGLVHATALVVGTSGILVTGQSGAGKSLLARRLISAAAHHGVYAALVADDQVLLSRKGDRIVAAAPQTIAGMIELRGSGIARVAHLPRAVLRMALAPAVASGEDRVPPEDDWLDLGPHGRLPLFRVPYANVDDPVATLTAVAGHL